MDACLESFSKMTQDLSTIVHSEDSGSTSTDHLAIEVEGLMFDVIKPISQHATHEAKRE